MRLWDVSGPEVEAADAAPWDGPMAGAMRPFSTRALVQLCLAGALLYGLSGFAGLVLALDARDHTAHSGSFIAFNVVALGFCLGLLGQVLALTPQQLRRYTPSLGLGLLLVTPFVVTLGLGAGGPRFGVVTVALGSTPLFSYYVLRRRWAVLQSACLLGCLAVLLWVQDGWAAPLPTWLFVAANVIGGAVVIGLMALRADELAASEHEARVQLVELNQTLEERVTSQVGEIERLGGLRRFLSPQVADAMLSEDSAELSRAHRARIAVFFCDLRGFTGFTNHAEPEEVIGVLDEYYGAVGTLLRRYDATVGDYAGDGIMAYFGDPVPRDDAALAAVEMTHQVRLDLEPVVSEWRRRGIDLDFGIGLAYGYATLGVVGFDGRHDYKPVGGVVNLAARLCGRAAGGQVLLDHATHVATSERFPSEHVGDYDLKGYADPIPVYAPAAAPH